jgi:thiamine-phosphate pyrophosphorylase
MQNKKISRLHYISQETKEISHQECILNALKGGVKWVQLRVKDKTEEQVHAIASEVKTICKEFKNVTLILNDYLSIAKELDFDGIHLGMTDTSTLIARAYLGKDKIIGGTANTLENIIFHYKNGVDYVGIGPYKHTFTKNNLSPIIGIEGYKVLIEQLAKHKINLPLIAIGGIVKEDFKDLSEIGVHGVALASLINLDKNPINKSKEIIKELQLQWKN